MIWNNRVRVSLAVLVCTGALLSAQAAPACSVCFGDPTSNISQGAQAGMLVLLGVVGSVLLAFAGLLIFWIRRAAKFENQGGAGEGLRGVHAPAAYDDRSGA